MDRVCEFQEGSLAAVSYCSPTVPPLLDCEFDMLIVVSSWEERVRSVLSSPNLRALASVLVLYDEVDPDGLRLLNDGMLELFLRRRSKFTTILRRSAVDLAGTWNGLLTSVVTCCKDLGRPIRILLDATTCQRYHILALIAKGFELGLVRHLSLFYASGEYPDKSEEMELVFGDGTWRSIPVPGLEGEYGPGRRLGYYVSVGFEGYKTLRAVARADPDRVVILFPDPGTKPGYAIRTEEANARLIEEYAVDPEAIVRAQADDAISAWQAMATANLENTREENMVFLLNGTKPHSIAMGLRAIALRNPAVLYSVPEAYHVVDIRATGTFWRYDIQSLTIP